MKKLKNWSSSSRVTVNVFCSKRNMDAEQSSGLLLYYVIKRGHGCFNQRQRTP